MRTKQYLTLVVTVLTLVGCAGPQTTHNQDLQGNKTDAAAWLNKGGAEEINGRHVEAIQCYDRALEIDPRLALAWSEKGVALGKLGRLNEARQCFDRALEINPRHAMTWVNKGVIVRKLGRIEEELDYCDRALKIDPRFGVAWYNKGAAFYQLKRYAEARKAFEQAEALGIADARRALTVLDKEEGGSSKPSKPDLERAISGSASQQYFGLQPPVAAAESVVTARIKNWQQDCDRGKYAYGQPQKPQFTITGQGMSLFTLKRTKDTYVASAEIPSPDGKTSTKGALIQIRTLSISGEPVSSIVLSGVVWTPRVSVIGKLDLSGTTKITTSPDFSFESFKDSPFVIPFANGYAVNLFGQKLDEGGLIDSTARPKGNYVSEEGKPLYGRLIRSRFGKLEEIIFAP